MRSTANPPVYSQVAYDIALSCVDDVEYVMALKEREKDSMRSLMEDDEDDVPVKKKAKAPANEVVEE